MLLLIVYNFNFLKKEIKQPKEYILRVLEVRENYVIATTGEENIYVYNIGNISINDIVEVKGNYERISSFKNLHTFDFSLYAYRNQANFQIYTSDFEIKAKSKSMQATLYNHIQNLENEALKEYYDAIFYNKKSQDDGNDFFYLGGFHLQFFIYLLSKVKKLNKALLEIIFSFLYVLFFPMRFFVLYFFIKGCISFLCKHLNDKNQVGAITMLLLFYNPMLIYHIGFIILMCFSYLRLFNVTKRMRRLLHFFILLPIQLYNFHYVNLLTILLFRPFQWIQSWILMLSMISLFFPSLGIIFDFLYHQVGGIGSEIPETFTLIGKPHLWWILLWGILIYQIISTNKRTPILFLGILLIYHLHMDRLNLFGEVMFIDVGQGDCILIHEPLFGKTILIDVAGSLKYDLASEVIFPVLRSKGIRHIDAVVITHDDYDHNGGLKKLSQLVDIDETFNSVEELELSNITLFNLNHSEYDDKNDNSIVLFGSIYGVNYLFTGDAGYQVEEEIVNMYSELKVDILKVSHHGADTATSASFLQKINPQIGIISSGKNNAYGHPDKALLERLEMKKVTIFNTQEVGSISFFYSRYFHLMRTGDKKFGIIKR
ncbi:MULTISPECIES: MBL fold metallo-hydrolase [unclassified Breznakia]|uniref:MBL fold metallo-hydrolase n=1 Tax=unclassified Breznakia TaxID=2623764 RepID=UPI0024056DF7|nr:MULTISPECIES: MBL fold metallo-hydrolase [unclassified Breznakia]